MIFTYSFRSLYHTGINDMKAGSPSISSWSYSINFVSDMKMWPHENILHKNIFIIKGELNWQTTPSLCLVSLTVLLFFLLDFSLQEEKDDFHPINKWCDTIWMMMILIYVWLKIEYAGSGTSSWTLWISWKHFWFFIYCNKFQSPSIIISKH